MSVYQVTYMWPVPAGMTTEPMPITVTGVQAADVQMDDHAVTLVDANRNILLMVPWYLSPVVMLTATS